MRIALLEDDPVQAVVLKGWLEAVDHACQHFVDARSFQRGFRRESFDLLIMDWELPESSGIEVLRWVREYADWHIPVLFVTARDSERDIVYALEQGADDYMTKPVSRSVTLARINALARRAGGAARDDSILEMGAYRIDRRSGIITHAGRSVDLTEKEFKLAVMLFGNIGRLLSRDHLLETVWGLQAGIATRTVDTHMSRLRQKLRLTPEEGWRLKAVYHHGYRLERVPEAAESLAPTSDSGYG